MKKIIAIVLVAVLALGVLTACGKKADDKTITVAASPTPHAEMLKVAADVLAKDGYTLKITEYSDYVQPNNVVEDGEMDANFFQHVPYLDSFNQENGTHLVSVCQVHYEPFAVYAGTKDSLEALADGDQIAVPNDTTNRARALLLLQDNGLLKLKDGVGLDCTVLDIVENPLNLKIVEMEAAQISSVRDSVALVVLNGNYAGQAGLHAGPDGVAVENSESVAADTYANVLVVKEGNENQPKIQALKKALMSDEVRDFVNNNTEYAGGVIPLF